MHSPQCVSLRLLVCSVFLVLSFKVPIFKTLQQGTASCFYSALSWWLSSLPCTFVWKSEPRISLNRALQYFGASLFCLQLYFCFSFQHCWPFLFVLPEGKYSHTFCAWCDFRTVCRPCAIGLFFCSWWSAFRLSSWLLCQPKNEA